MKKHIYFTYNQEVFVRKKHFVKVFWSKVDNLILKFFSAAPTKAGASEDTNFEWYLRTIR